MSWFLTDRRAMTSIFWLAAGSSMALSSTPVRCETAPMESIVELKRAALEVLRSQPASGSVDSKIFFDAGDRDPALLLDEAELVVDRLPAINYHYSNSEAQALHQNGLSRIAALDLEPGTHHLRLKFAARYVDAPREQARAIAYFEHDITIAAPASTIEFELIKSAVLGRPDIQLMSLEPSGDGAVAANGAKASSSADLRLREAAYLTASGRPFAALRSLYSLEAGGVSSDDLRLRIAEASAAFGVETPVATDVASSGAAAAGAVESPVDAFNRASALLKEGHTSEGSAAMEAVATSKGDSEALAQLRDRANLVLGYALLRSRAGASAAPAFGRVRSTGPYTNAALLGLGWSMLAPTGNTAAVAAAEPRVIPASASQPLPRIPTLLQPALTADIATLKQHEPYALHEAMANEEHAVRRALVPWTELIGRDPLDPAVQEGAVAIPYVLNHIGAHQEALDYYRRTIYLLEALDHHLDLALKQVAAGRLLTRLAAPEASGQGWSWWMAALPPQHWWLANDPSDAMAAPEGFYLPKLMDEPDFRAAMDDWHDLGLLDSALASAGDAPEATPARARLAAGLHAESELLDDLATGKLNKMKRQTEMYLGEARFALGRINEDEQREARR